jgi:hypothetical protein
MAHEQPRSMMHYGLHQLDAHQQRRATMRHQLGAALLGYQLGSSLPDGDPGLSLGRCFASV